MTRNARRLLSALWLLADEHGHVPTNLATGEIQRWVFCGERLGVGPRGDACDVLCAVENLICELADEPQARQRLPRRAGVDGCEA